MKAILLRRRFVGLLWLCILCATAVQAAETSKPSPKLNVLFIAIDDLNHWTGYLDRNVRTKTPNIDRLAARGVWFARSYCAAPVCNPSRAALMSGLRPFTSGVYENGNDWRRAIPEDLPLTTTFRKAGYYVCGAGKIYHEAYRRRSEWDDYLENSGRDPEPAGNPGVGGISFAPLDCGDEDLREWKIVGYGIEQLQRKHDKPFFLAIGLHKPHLPWNVPKLMKARQGRNARTAVDRFGRGYIPSITAAKRSPRVLTRNSENSNPSITAS